ncbi:MAG: type IIA DNA topoisomerase subunit B [Armatimonadetes bacterium]|nr:type IIA DNA topoisomerase subunit B [Armatimonadota bacterium]
MAETAERSEPIGRVDTEYNASQLQLLEGLEPVRRRPAMFIGDNGIKGLHHLVEELVANSVDEALAGRCTEINVVVHPDKSVTVTDDGYGIPVDTHEETGLNGLELVMTRLHAGGKFGGGAYKVSGGLHGVGLSCVNALSEWTEATIRRDGFIWRQRFERGPSVTPLEKLGKTREKGTSIRFRPDPIIFEKIEFHADLLTNRLRELAFLNKGLKITFEDERTGRAEEFCYKGGIVQFVEHLNRNKEPVVPSKPVYFIRTRDDIEVEIALQYNSSYQENILTYANNINTTEGGTHLSGFKTALTRVLNQYARKAGLLKEKEPNLGGDDVREGLTAVVSVKLPQPQFESQTKIKLNNPEAEGTVNSVVGEGLATFLEEHPGDARKVIDKSLTAFRAREAARKAADAIKRQNILDNSALPGKLADCSEKDPAKCELFIVEGESAGGSAKGGRNPRFQAILPLRGKPLNVEKARMDRALDNNEISALITCIGTGIAKSVFLPADAEDEENGNGNGANGHSNGDGVSRFDYKKLRYQRIILMTDADVDGAHIRTLLLTFLFRYMAPLVERGHVYIAKAPLYKLTAGRTTEYAWSDEERDQKLKALQRRNVSVSRFKGLGEMDPEELRVTTMDPEQRTILQVEMEDAVKADEIFTVLMGDKVEPRKDFIEKHAKEVEQLDV